MPQEELTVKFSATATAAALIANADDFARLIAFPG